MGGFRTEIRFALMEENLPAGLEAFKMSEKSAAKWYTSLPDWWSDHYESAPQQVMDFFAGDGISLQGKTILDVGCGDGILSLGLLEKTKATRVVGVDLFEVDREELKKVASRNGKIQIPSTELLTFLKSTPTSIPLETSSVDVVVSWSVFEHVEDFESLWSEIRRVLKPGGLIFTQIWPMFWSEHGSHLWPWMNDSFIQYKKAHTQIIEDIESSIEDEGLSNSVRDLYMSCNRITVDELQDSMLSAGLTIAKVELSTEGFHLDEHTQRIPLSRLGITGIKILAISP